MKYTSMYRNNSPFAVQVFTHNEADPVFQSLSYHSSPHRLYGGWSLKRSRGLPHVNLLYVTFTLYVILLSSSFLWHHPQPHHFRQFTLRPQVSHTQNEVHLSINAIQPLRFGWQLLWSPIIDRICSSVKSNYIHSIRSYIAIFPWQPITGITPWIVMMQI